MKPWKLALRDIGQERTIGTRLKDDFGVFWTSLASSPARRERGETNDHRDIVPHTHQEFAFRHFIPPLVLQIPAERHHPRLRDRLGRSIDCRMSRRRKEAKHLVLAGDGIRFVRDPIGDPLEHAEEHTELFFEVANLFGEDQAAMVPLFGLLIDDFCTSLLDRIAWRTGSASIAENFAKNVGLAYLGSECPCRNRILSQSLPAKGSSGDQGALSEFPKNGRRMTSK